MTCGRSVAMPSQSIATELRFFDFGLNERLDTAGSVGSEAAEKCVGCRVKRGLLGVAGFIHQTGPTVNVTRGQRAHLLDNRLDDLPSVSASGCFSAMCGVFAPSVAPVDGSAA